MPKKPHLPEVNFRRPPKPKLNFAPARRDGRPLYFDVAEAGTYQCYQCNKLGLTISYPGPKIGVNDPANPPGGVPQGEMHTVCYHHIPENAVIFNPVTGMCRDRNGNEWREE